jgi:hypothetical protein
MPGELLDLTRFLVKRCGLSPFAARLDGSKAPDAEVLPLFYDESRGEHLPSWKPYQDRRPLEYELVRMFGGLKERGIAVACGLASGNLEVIDCDDTEAGKELLEWDCQVLRFCTDEWESYSKYLPEARHWVGKELMQGIERNNLNFRTHIKRMQRETICFLKAEDMHEAVMRLYIRHLNARQHLL